MVDVVIFEGGTPGSEAAEMVVKARRAALADNVAKLLYLDEVRRIIIAADCPNLDLPAVPGRIFVEESSPGHFHFGRMLMSIAEKYRLETVLYLGGGSVPLITTDELSLACRLAQEKKERFVANNVQSPDLVAFSPSRVFERCPLPDSDNSLGLLLRYTAGLEQVLLPATAGTQFDIDTPADLLVLSATGLGGPKLQEALQFFALDVSAVRRLQAVLRDDYRELTLAGRVGTSAMDLLNTSFKVRLRVFSEERGMKALGRLESNEVVSLLGYLLEDVGPEAFFSYLSRTSSAALIDTRVLFAHGGRKVTESDRFFSDLGLPDKIIDPWVQAFTSAALNCRVPVLLGGHSLVTGCVWALATVAE